MENKPLAVQSAGDFLKVRRLRGVGKYSHFPDRHGLVQLAVGRYGAAVFDLCTCV